MEVREQGDRGSKWERSRTRS